MILDKKNSASTMDVTFAGVVFGPNFDKNYLGLLEKLTLSTATRMSQEVRING